MSSTTLDPRSLDAVLDHVANVADPGASRCEVLWATVDGERVVVKAGVGRARAALRREAEALERIGVPGLVAVVGVHESDSVTALVMADAGQRTLGRPADATAEVLLRALMHTCRIVDEVHRAGWCHGRLTPDHVVVGARGRVRVCSLGAARPTSDRPDGVAEDQRALRRLVVHVAREIEEHGGHARTARRLRRLADPEGDDGQLDAAGLAERLEAVQQHGPRGPRWTPRWPDGRRPSWLAAIGVACAALAIGAAWTSLPVPSAGGVDEPADTRGGGVVPLTVSPSSSASSTLGASTTSPARTTPAAPIGPAPTVVLDGATYRVGLPGDLAVTGDWNCDGTATVRALRPATGELFELAPDRSGSGTTTGTLVRVIEGATMLRTDGSTTPGACDRTVVRRADGSDQVVP